ncbi:MAG: hypothetical protein U1E60_01780 [Reyranellaceae bacterium]
MTYNIADGDTGFDRIFVAAIPSGANSITVNATTAGYNTAFESGLFTAAINPGTGLVDKSALIGNPNAANTLGLIADGGIANVFSLGGFGTFDMQTVKGVFGGNGTSARSSSWRATRRRAPG